MIPSNACTPRITAAAGTELAGAYSYNTIWGQVGIASGVTIESGTVLLAKCGVNRNLKKETYFGPIAEEFRSYVKKEVKLKNLK